MPRISAPICLSLLAIALSVGVACAQSPPPVTSMSSLGAARADVLTGGRVVVVSMDANGDLPGMVTLTLNVSGGAITGGSWVLVMSSRQPGVVGASAPADADHRDAEGGDEPASQVGTLGGSIAAGGSVRTDVDGRLVAVIGAQLVIDTATPNAPGIQGGYGQADASDLHDYSASHGSLSLTF